MTPDEQTPNARNYTRTRGARATSMPNPNPSPNTHAPQAPPPSWNYGLFRQPNVHASSRLRFNPPLVRPAAAEKARSSKLQRELRPVEKMTVEPPRGSGPPPEPQPQPQHARAPSSAPLAGQRQPRQPTVHASSRPRFNPPLVRPAAAEKARSSKLQRELRPGEKMRVRATPRFSRPPPNQPQHARAPSPAPLAGQRQPRQPTVHASSRPRFNPPSVRPAAAETARSSKLQRELRPVEKMTIREAPPPPPRGAARGSSTNPRFESFRWQPLQLETSVRPAAAQRAHDSNLLAGQRALEKVNSTRQARAPSVRPAAAQRAHGSNLLAGQRWLRPLEQYGSNLLAGQR